MKTIVQRVSRASVRVEGSTVAEIGPGILALVGVEKGDRAADALCTAHKIADMRIFPGTKAMDQSVQDIEGSCLVVSQFTLAARLSKGRRPSFNDAAAPSEAESLYLQVAQALEAKEIPVARGVFAANMQVELVNDGPATFVIHVRQGQLLDL